MKEFLMVLLSNWKTILSVLILFWVIGEYLEIKKYIMARSTDKLFFSIPVSEHNKFQNMLNSIIEETFNNYCAMNFDHVEDIFITEDMQKEIITNVSKEVYDLMSPTLILALSAIIDKSYLPVFITNKIIALSNLYTINKNTI